MHPTDLWISHGNPEGQFESRAVGFCDVLHMCFKGWTKWMEDGSTSLIKSPMPGKSQCRSSLSSGSSSGPLFLTKEYTALSMTRCEKPRNLVKTTRPAVRVPQLSHIFLVLKTFRSHEPNKYYIYIYM